MAHGWVSGLLTIGITLAALASLPSRAQVPSTDVPVEIVPAAGHTASVQNVAYSPDGKWIASVANDDTAKLWDAKIGTLIRTFSHGHWAVAFTRDSRALLTAKGSTIRLWDIRTGAVVREYDAAPHARSGPTPHVYAVASSPDGSHFASSGEGEIIIWKVDSGRPLRVIHLPSYSILHIAYSPDGKMIASASQDNNFRLPVVNIFDAITGRHIRALATNMHSANSVSFSSDGTLLAASVANANYVYSAHIWDTATGALVSNPGQRLERMDFVTFLRDGNSIILHNPKIGMEIWDIRGASAIKTIKSNLITYDPQSNFNQPGNENFDVISRRCD